MLECGSFIGFLPDHYAERGVAQSQRRALLPERYHYDIPLAVVTRQGRRPNLILERFLEELAGTA